MEQSGVAGLAVVQEPGRQLVRGVGGVPEIQKSRNPELQIPGPRPGGQLGFWLTGILGHSIHIVADAVGSLPECLRGEVAITLGDAGV